MIKKNLSRAALVATSRLVEFAGAEITALEIAETLQTIGYTVQLAALEIGEPLKTALQQKNIPLIHLSSPDISNQSFELVWIFHNITAYHVFINANMKAEFAVFSSLSHFEPIENPPLSHLRFSTYSVHSKENYDFFIKKYPDLKNNLCILPNAAPVAFFNAFQTQTSQKKAAFNKIAIISNHPPREVLDLIPRLKQKSVTVDLFGLFGQKTLINSTLITSYDAIITIGKSVQYCLASGIPVFCYDHFGGPGWITIENFSAAKDKNFSGRCCKTKYSAENLEKALYEGYSTAIAERKQLHEKAKLEFNLLKNIKTILCQAGKQAFSVTLSDTDKSSLLSKSDLFLNQRENFNKINEELKALHGHISNIYNSKTWRLITYFRQMFTSSKLKK